MTTLLASFELKDFIIIGVVVVALLIIAASAQRPEPNLGRLEMQIQELRNKLDALLKHHGVELPPPPPSGLSPEVERLASSPDTKIAAIKLYREQNPGASLLDAKLKIEAFYNGLK